jgi:hypothetical protein
MSRTMLLEWMCKSRAAEGLWLRQRWGTTSHLFKAISSDQDMIVTIPSYYIGRLARSSYVQISDFWSTGVVARLISPCMPCESVAIETVNSKALLTRSGRRLSPEVIVDSVRSGLYSVPVATSVCTLDCHSWDSHSKRRQRGCNKLK